MSRTRMLVGALVAGALVVGVIYVTQVSTTARVAETAHREEQVHAAVAEGATVPPATAVVVDDICPHPYVRVGPGSTWRYRVRGADGNEVQAALSVEHVARTGERYEVRYRAETAGVSREYVQACDAETADEPWSLAVAADVRSVGPSWQVLARYSGDETQYASFETRAYDVEHHELRNETVSGARLIRVIGVEDVEVPAGRFRALHIAFEERRTDVAGDTPRLGDQWLAEDVGLVRATVRLRDGTVLADQELVQVLDPA